MSPAAMPAAIRCRQFGSVAIAASVALRMSRHSMVMTGPCDRLIVPVVVLLG